MTNLLQGSYCKLCHTGEQFCHISQNNHSKSTETLSLILHCGRSWRWSWLTELIRLQVLKSLGKSEEIRMLSLTWACWVGAPECGCGLGIQRLGCGRWEVGGFQTGMIGGFFYPYKDKKTLDKLASLLTPELQLHSFCFKPKITSNYKYTCVCVLMSEMRQGVDVHECPHVRLQL